MQHITDAESVCLTVDFRWY